MLGAIIGDIAGSVYEFNPTTQTDFNLLGETVNYTDDSIISFAFADWILTSKSFSHDDLEKCILRFTDTYTCPLGGYGYSFCMWLKHTWSKRTPYNSYGNGSAMRVSSIGWMFDTLEETERIAEISAAITHDHPEGIKGAKATAAAIFMARTGKTKAEIKEYIQSRYEYDLDQTCDDIRNTPYTMPESCQATMPGALVAFLESKDFESSIRLAISLARDADTLACINGGIAEAYYKEIPTWMKDKAYSLLPSEFRDIIHRLADNTVYGKLIPIHEFSNIERFVDLQKDTYGRALFELQQGKKKSDWNIGLLFPILKADSDMENSVYSFENISEVERYLQHPLLRRRMKMSVDAASRYSEDSLAEILGAESVKAIKTSIALMNEVLAKSGETQL